MCEFEEKVKKALEDILESSDKPRIGVAVSGGADSMALLLAMSELISPLYVITINHNIRPAEESAGDVDFVNEVCEELKSRGLQIDCKTVELARGTVAHEAGRRGAGVEEAARYLRYAAFEKFVAERGLEALCLAHNKNDQLETVLMRFLQGSPAEAAAGIQARRGGFVRPLLGLSRQEIEAYVRSRGFEWRTDKTNFETDYFRNKIRLKLVPFLDENFSGWQTALLAGAEKAADDSALIQSCLEKYSLSVDNEGNIELPFSDFLQAPQSVKYRLLLEACNMAGESGRIPHLFLKDVISSLEAGASSNALNSSNAHNSSDAVSDSSASFTKHFAGIDIICKKNHLFVKKHTENNTDCFFSDIIEKTGTFEFPFGLLNVFNYKEQGGKATASISVGEVSHAEGLSLPFRIRSPQPGDTVISADGSEKKVSDILSDWHVPPEKRWLIPVIQLLDDKAQPIKAILAGFSGYKDWIVKL